MAQQQEQHDFMVEVRPTTTTGSGSSNNDANATTTTTTTNTISKGLFATKTYEIGDIIVANEIPLMVLDECDWKEAELTTVLTNLKLAFDKTIKSKSKSNNSNVADRILNLYCPNNNAELNQTVFANQESSTLTVEKVDAVANQLFPDYDYDYNTALQDGGQQQHDHHHLHILTRLLCIWKLNSTAYNSGVRGKNQSALLELHARMNHSCCPNAVFLKTTGTIRAQKHIAAGEEITHCYIGMESAIASTRIRRLLLKQQCYFYCTCQRCNRPMDLCRIRQCPSCHKHSLIPGLQSMTTLTEEQEAKEEQKESATTTTTNSIDTDRIATCALCKETFDYSNNSAAATVIKTEMELEDQTLALWTMPPPQTPQEQYQLQQIVQTLHRRICGSNNKSGIGLGGCHWTAAALTKIRYDIDPMINGFVILQWGEAHARWCKLVLGEDMPALAPQLTYNVGKNCQPLVSKPYGTQSKLFEITGRRYWNECYMECQQLWGGGDSGGTGDTSKKDSSSSLLKEEEEEDRNLQNIRIMLAKSKAANVRVDMIVCTDKLCKAVTHDGVTVMPAAAANNNNNQKKACSACGLAHYCNKNCQKEDWNSHKEVCKSVRSLKDLQETINALKSVGRF